ncbi:pyridoxamine 5'-phosphate oxidase family protein [Dongia soli]|uniref:Pyridoxamine 5'-phosphate oxidase family protein n=1 Tax=Dongia soli TaxID=600628 RepID=A0ABU5ECI4_9PROT|nr:pyridoxamine 5'-phosphate oxidase family protein [Dongia soli]MDY0883901.1 pyridoxamine 5'-phosphate oxidase family protein [Dongia soli]
MTIDAALARLEEAVRLRRGAFCLAALATVAEDRPQVRNVIIRNFSATGLILTFFCRSDDAKYREILANPQVELVVYGRDPDCQIRLAGRAENISDATSLDRYWTQVSQTAQRDYVAEGTGPTDGRAALFAAIEVKIERIKVLTFENDRWRLQERGI